MEEFDFNAPVTATVIFDESDDETLETRHSVYVLEEEKKTKIDLSKTLNNLVIKNNKSVNDLSKKSINDTIIVKPKCPKIARKNKKPSSQCINNINSSKTKPPKKQSPKRKSLDMPSLELDSSALDNASSTVQQDSNKETNTHNNTDEGTRKRKKITDLNMKSERNLPEPNVEKESNATEIYEHNQTGGTKISQNIVESCNQVASDLTNAQASSCNSPKQTNKPENQCKLKIDVIPKFAHHLNQEKPNSDTRALFQLNKLDNNMSVANYLQQSLNTVSEHIIYVSNYYQSYARICRSGSDRSLIEQAKNNFLRTRNQFFALSYSSVVNIILPRSNDSTFVKNFITDTSKIALSKSLNYPNAILEPIFMDMLQYVKTRQQEIQNMNINKIPSQPPCPLLTQELQKPLQKMTSTIYQTQERLLYQENQGSRRNYAKSTHSSVSYGQNCNIAPTYLNKEILIPRGITLQDTEKLSPTTKPPPPYPKQSEPTYRSNSNCSTFSGPLEEIRLHDELRYYNKHNESTPHHCSLIMLPQSTQDEYQNQVYNKQLTENLPYKQNNGSSSYQNVQSHQHFREIQKLPPFDQLSLQKPFTQTWQNPASQTPAAHYWQTPDTQLWQKPAAQPQNQATQPWQKQTSQSWQNPIPTMLKISQNYQGTDLLGNSQHFPTENTIQPEPTRSSISRDSGFISPPNFNISSDQLSNIQDEQISQPSPLITHVTSLNPNVNYIIDGCCAVCGKTTKQKCIGCYKCYYCSHGCQSLDWKKHQVVCKSN